MAVNGRIVRTCEARQRVLVRFNLQYRIKSTSTIHGQCRSASSSDRSGFPRCHKEPSSTHSTLAVRQRRPGFSTFQPVKFAHMCHSSNVTSPGLLLLLLVCSTRPSLWIGDSSCGRALGEKRESKGAGIPLEFSPCFETSGLVNISENNWSATWDDYLISMRTEGTLGDETSLQGFANRLCTVLKTQVKIKVHRGGQKAMEFKSDIACSDITGPIAEMHIALEGKNRYWSTMPSSDTRGKYNARKKEAESKPGVTATQNNSIEEMLRGSRLKHDYYQTKTGYCRVILWDGDDDDETVHLVVDSGRSRCFGIHSWLLEKYPKGKYDLFRGSPINLVNCIKWYLQRRDKKSTPVTEAEMTPSFLYV